MCCDMVAAADRSVRTAQLMAVPVIPLPRMRRSSQCCFAVVQVTVVILICIACVAQIAYARCKALSACSSTTAAISTAPHQISQTKLSAVFASHVWLHLLLLQVCTTVAARSAPC
jgi:hypothetical protein